VLAGQVWAVVGSEIVISRQENSMLATYYPEMNEVKPAAEIEARLGHYGKHWFIKTKLTLKGRGIAFIRTLAASDLVMPQGERLIGCHEYKVTEAAFQRICQEHSVSSECLL
jgi:hypothetical protein